jgi:hypothetical protein
MLHLQFRFRKEHKPTTKITNSNQHKSTAKITNSNQHKSSETRTGNRYQARSNFVVTSFPLPSPLLKAIVTYPVFEVIWGPTDEPINQPTNGQTNIVSYRGATSRLKITNINRHKSTGINAITI